MSGHQTWIETVLLGFMRLANLSALINSNEKSQIGKISLYKESAKETLAAKDKYTLILMDLESSVTVWKEAKEDYDNYRC